MYCICFKILNCIIVYLILLYQRDYETHTMLQLNIIYSFELGIREGCMIHG